MIEKNIIERLPNEHFLVYLDRLLNLKENKAIDIEKSEIYNLVFEKELSSCESRKRLYLWEEIINKAKKEGQDLNSIVDTVTELISPNEKDETEVLTKYLTDEEDRIQIIDMGEKYTIYNNIRSLVIDKSKVKLIKELYCDDNGLTINELCRKINIPRRDFMLVKNAFNITHDDVPYIDEEIKDDNLQNLVDATLERRKEKYFIKLQQEEIKQMKIELSKYRKQDYLFDKVIDAINDIKIDPVKYSVEIPNRNKSREALLDIMDQHIGIKTDNYWNKYSVEEAKRRFEVLTKETIEFCTETGVTILHVSSLGDCISGIIHNSLRLEAEIDVVEQVKVATTLIGKMLMEFALVFDKVIYTDVVGNHGRIMPLKSDSINEENLEYLITFSLKLMLKNIKNIEFEDNYYDDDIIVKNIAGVTIFETHGDKDKITKIAQDLTMMLDKPNEIHSAHTHHSQADEVHGVEIFIGRSFSGVDTYSKNLRLTSKAGQKLYVYENGKRIFIHDIVFN